MENPPQKNFLATPQRKIILSPLIIRKRDGRQSGSASDYSVEKKSDEGEGQA